MIFFGASATLWPMNFLFQIPNLSFAFGVLVVAGERAAGEANTVVTSAGLGLSKAKTSRDFSIVIDSSLKQKNVVRLCRSDK